MHVSLCLIVRDEEAALPACLGCVADLVDEIVVVDTGSTDQTKEAATQLGARVFDFPWCDDFSAARNETLQHATGDWIFWMDADDRLDDANRSRLRALFAGLPDQNLAYVMKCVCAPDPVTGSRTVLDHGRLFRRRPDIRWQYRVHEQILPSVERSGGSVVRSDVVIEHMGYTDAALLRRKRERNLRLLQRQHAEQPDDPATLCNLGNALHLTGRNVDALPLMLRCLQIMPPGWPLGRKLFEVLAPVLYLLGRKAESLSACEQGRRLYPQSALVWFYEGQLRLELGDRAGAETCLSQVLRPGMEGVGRHLARHKLAILCCQQGRLDEAEHHWRLALHDRPGCAEAEQGLAELDRYRARLGSGTAR